jgi:four helix bundle protein
VRNLKSEIRNPKQLLPLLMPAGEGKPYDLRARTLAFSIRILRISGALPETIEGSMVRRQLIRAGTSVGANVQEADGAVTRADTRRSFVISKKEAQECAYWLRIVDELWGAKVSVKKDIDEVEPLTRILRSIIDRLGK